MFCIQRLSQTWLYLHKISPGGAVTLHQTKLAHKSLMLQREDPVAEIETGILCLFFPGSSGLFLRFKGSGHAALSRIWPYFSDITATHLHEVSHGGAVALHQVGGVEAPVRVPAHGQLLLGELEQVVQGLVVDLAVAGPAPNPKTKIEAGLKPVMSAFCTG